jgi:hypothetical protein
MARMIPPVVSEACKSDAEADVFETIKCELSDDWTALHSVGLTVHERKPWAEADFVLIGPLGVFVLEVKGGGIRRERGMWIHTNRHGKDSDAKAQGPFDQAGGASAALFKYLAGKLPAIHRSMVGYGVVAPDIKFNVRGPDIDLELVYDASDVPAAFAAYLERLAGRWREKLTDTKRSPPTGIDTRMRQEIVDLIRPDFDARLSLRSRAVQINKELLRLTVEQYRVLEGLAGNDRAVIMGTAGTGKTLLAVEEAARYSRLGYRVALLCYNRNLAEHLIKVVADIPGVSASSMHAMLRDIVHRAGLEDQLPAADETHLFEVSYPDLAFRALVDGLVPDRYDVVVVDEAQDLLSGRYTDVVDALLDGGLAGGRWRLFYDPRQDLFEGSEPGILRRIRATGASYSLTVNCRNTRPIGVETGMLCGIPPTETLVADGPEVKRRWYVSEREQLRLLGRDLNNTLIGGFSPNDLVVLGRRRLANSTFAGSIPGIPFRLVDVGLGTLPKACLRYSTVQAFKGLEADAVFLVDIDDLLSDQSVGSLYVGSSRARTDLFLYLSAAVRAQYDDRAVELGLRLADLD